MLIIGLTGGIASGKTTVSNILRKKGAVIIDADLIARQILEKGTAGWKMVKDYFGDEILHKNGEINRSKLGQIVFSDQKKLKKLEEITHPFIFKEIKRKIECEQENNTSKIPLILDAALLFETDLDRLVDQTWVVYVDRSTQFERLRQRDDLSRQEAAERIDAQLPLSKKVEIADIVIDNRGNLSQLRNKINILWEKIKD